MPPPVLPSAHYNRLWFDGDYTAAKPVGLPKFSQPFNGDPGEYILTQDFEMFSEWFTPLALNTVHPWYVNYFLVNEGAQQDIGNGVVKWTRTYAQVPNSRSDAASIIYKYPGFAGLQGLSVAANPPIGTINGRSFFSITTNCRIQYDYFIAPSSGIDPIAKAIDGSALPFNITAATPITDIPVVTKLKYYFPAGTWVAGTGGHPIQFVPLPDPIQAYEWGIPTDYLQDGWITYGITHGVYQIGDSPATSPSRTAYQQYIQNKAEIVAEDSTLSRWMGNIYVRSTKFVIAQ